MTNPRASVLSVKSAFPFLCHSSPKHLSGDPPLLRLRPKTSIDFTFRSRRLSPEVDCRIVIVEPDLTGERATEQIRQREEAMSDQHHENSVDRRRVLQAVAGIGAASLMNGRVSPAADDGPVAKKGRIKQSLVNWCYNKAWPDVDEFCRTAVQLGCRSIELIDPTHWPTLKKHGLTCAIAGSHGFRVGPNNRDEWDQCRDVLRKRLQQCADFGVERLITFTGMAKGLSQEEGADNCVEFFKQLVGEAEQKDVTLCLEMLNTRDDSHPMKGHPGYQGDDTEYCIDIINRVASPRFKLLFDIYHVQIMNGDVIRRIHEHKEHIAHVHTAGNPGRAEIDETQEINYPAVMQALLDIQYDGYVGQEFIPTGDALTGLQQAVKTCDV